MPILLLTVRIGKYEILTGNRYRQNQCFRLNTQLSPPPSFNTAILTFDFDILIQYFIFLRKQVITTCRQTLRYELIVECPFEQHTETMDEMPTPTSPRSPSPPPPFVPATVEEQASPVLCSPLPPPLVPDVGAASTSQTSSVSKYADKQLCNLILRHSRNDVNFFLMGVIMVTYRHLYQFPQFCGLYFFTTFFSDPFFVTQFFLTPFLFDPNFFRNKNFSDPYFFRNKNFGTT